MHARRIGSILVSLLLCFTIANSADSEPTVVSGGSGLEATLAGHFKSSVDHYAAGDFAQSLESSEQALALLNEQVAIAYNNICSAQMKLGSLDEAAKACKQALKIAPGYDRAWSNLTWVYAKQVERTPTAGAYLNLSVAHYWRDEVAESIAAAEKVLELDPRSAIARNNLCAAYAKSGSWERAVRECELALQIAPGYELAKNNLRWATTRKADGPG